MTASGRPADAPISALRSGGRDTATAQGGRMVLTEPTASSKLNDLRRERTSLFVGDVAASNSALLLHTLLGSCVSVCLFDPTLRAGGMNHILLPSSNSRESNSRCGVHAMELLINKLMSLGGDRKKFVAKAFGGARVLHGSNVMQIGSINCKFVRDFLVAEKIPLVAERLGGDHAVHLYFRTDTGAATVQTVDGSKLPKIIENERRFKETVTVKATGGEVTLF